MSDQYQELISAFSGSHNTLLTSLLCTENPTSWEDCKHLIVCPIPLLTLEMAINRVCAKGRKKHEIPTPEMIRKALTYANEKRMQYQNHIITEPLAAD